MLLPLNPQRIPWKKFRVDHRDQDLLLPNLSWDEKVVFTLNMVRRRGLFEYNPKKYSTLPTWFCQFNIAFFDLDKECEYILSMSYSLHLLVFIPIVLHAYPSTSCIRVYLAICLAFSCPYFAADFKCEPRLAKSLTLIGPWIHRWIFSQSRFLSLMCLIPLTYMALWWRGIRLTIDVFTYSSAAGTIPNVLPQWSVST